MEQIINKAKNSLYIPLAPILGSILVIILSLAIFLVGSVADKEIRAKQNTPFIGVNVAGYYTTMAESRTYNSQFPLNYYDESFRTISQANMNNIRYLFTWESYEKNPTQFVDELVAVANAADKWGIKVIYANDQYHISSWLDQQAGYGFPSILFENNPSLPQGAGGSSDTPAAEIWWTEWYNRSIKDINGNDGWKLQADFLKKVVNTVNNHISTLGYEILNEPQVYSVDQWDKLGKYNTFIASELRTLTKKTIVFDRQLPSDIGGPIDAFPENMAKMAPKNETNILFKSTVYGLPTHCSYAEGRLNTAATTAQILRIPLWIGEFNMGITRQHPFADLNQSELNLFVQKFKGVNAWGWDLWVWSFKPSASNVKNYNLVNLTSSNHHITIETTKYFDYLKNSISDTSGGESQTICPTISMTKIAGESIGIRSPSSGPLTLKAKDITVEGTAYNAATGIKLVEIHLDGQNYRSAVPISKGNWIRWYASMPISNASPGIHKLVAKATDYAGNYNYDTVDVNVS
ncbi:MAG: cellulase family glycosylhydrolase [Thermoproteota archaeon]|nr:cellulase family glycosylhydrolase [Thermoproteota archaeon]